jgi:DNA-binding LytR/AlgR family response regulator
MNQQTILLVEDNFLNRRLIKKDLEEFGYVVFESKNAKEAIHWLQTKIINLIILDINLGQDEQDGIGLAQFITNKFATPFIYLTAYDSSEILGRAIATEPLSYITKPFKKADLLAAVSIALQRAIHKEKQDRYLLVKDDLYNLKLSYDDIDYIESVGNYLLVYNNHKSFKIRYTLKQLMEFLPSSEFVQTHRAFVVNCKKIKKYNIREIIFNQNCVPVSKKYVSNLRVLMQPDQEI